MGGGEEEEDRNHQRSDDGTMEKGKETSNKKESRDENDGDFLIHVRQ